MAKNSDNDILSIEEVFYIFVGRLEEQGEWIRITKMINQRKTLSEMDFLLKFMFYQIIQA